MTSVADLKQRIYALVDQLPLAQLTALEGLLSAMVNPVAHSLANAPADDEPLTPKEEQALDRAEAWLAQNGGKGIPHEEILAEFGLTMGDFPAK
jgi:hypothetical protein